MLKCRQKSDQVRKLCCMINESLFIIFILFGSKNDRTCKQSNAKSEKYTSYYSIQLISKKADHSGTTGTTNYLKSLFHIASPYKYLFVEMIISQTYSFFNEIAQIAMKSALRSDEICIEDEIKSTHARRHITRPKANITENDKFLSWKGSTN